MATPLPGPPTPDSHLRDELSDLLLCGHTYAPTELVFADVPAAFQNTRRAGARHSLFDLLMHVGFAQTEVLRFFTEAGAPAPAYPVAFWPGRGSRGDEWKVGLDFFVAVRDRLARCVEDPARDLTAEFPQAPGHTMLGEVLRLTEHTAYHTGQAVSLRRSLGIWPPELASGDGAS